MSQVSDDGKLVNTFQDARGERRRNAFQELYDRYAGDVWRYLARLSDQQTADDLTQEVFVRALDGLDDFEGRSSFRTWIFRIATNLWKDHVKKKRPKTGIVEEEDRVEGRSPDQRVHRQERSEQVLEAVNDLSDKLKAAVVLVRFKDMTYEQAAEALDISTGTLKSRISRAYDKIYEQLKDTIQVEEE